MRLMIDIPEEDYIRIKHDCGKSVDNDPETFIKYPYMKRSDYYPVYLIGNGTPVPEKEEETLEEMRDEIIQDIQNGMIHITKGSERLFEIIDKHIGRG